MKDEKIGEVKRERKWQERTSVFKNEREGEKGEREREVGEE